ncbi:OpgC domain-containing protein [Methylobacterium sp. J-070]|uniref:OpgC domain-containing protein n=1 Tax=Methylobacterium sp. J-070 TaxID=2836650 RepID=UPI0028C461F4|nr:OpgC domain-containing protein [Methylobacterium sp. J-070]
MLPRCDWARAAARAYLAFALLQGRSWTEWGLPDLKPLALMQPDKGHVAPLRLLDILALTYLAFSSEAVRRLSTRPWLKPIDACSRHSLEIFATGCLAALVGRMSYRTFGPVWPLQIVMNLGGIMLMLVLANIIDVRARRRAAYECKPTR